MGFQSNFGVRMKLYVCGCHHMLIEKHLIFDQWEMYLKITILCNVKEDLYIKWNDIIWFDLGYNWRLHLLLLRSSRDQTSNGKTHVL